MSFGVIQHDSSHRLCSCSIEMLSALPRHSPITDKAEVRLEHQSGGLQRLARFLVGQLGCGKSTQLLVHQRQQLFGSGRVAGFDLGQDSCDIAHEDQDTASRQAIPSAAGYET
jgi:hypothetical protein